MEYDELPRSALIKLLEQHDAALAQAGKDGIVMNYTGRTAPWHIIRQVKPKLNVISKRLSYGDERDHGHSEVWNGENLSAMVTLFRHRGRVDLVLTDPPYNTGEDFRYNDKWDKDPNDPELGDLVPKDDGSRHSKWLKFMTPRIWMMREMLKPSGVIAICIDYRELFRLGMLMDEIFGEENRIGIINWQKAYSPKNDAKGVSNTTEYVLVYAKDRSRSRTGRVDFERGVTRNLDGDTTGLWIPSDPTARQHRKDSAYAIQSPVTGRLHYPNGEYNFSGALPEARAHWVNFTKLEAKAFLKEWGSDYVEKDLGDERGTALVLKRSAVSLKDYDPDADPIVKAAAKRAQARRDLGNWPKFYFRDDKARNPGRGRPRLKTKLDLIKKGKVPTTFWDEDYYDEPIDVGSVTWAHEESGHTDLAKRELDQVVGKNHGFDTVKPLRLIRKIIQIWCRPDGLVLDPFAGSGTTGHAVLDLNKETDATRQFILIEQGNTDKGDHYARTLTAERIKRVISGEWASGKRPGLPGSFRFIELKREQVDAEAVNALAREEMIDLLVNTYWDKSEKAKSYLRRYPAGDHKYLFGVNPRGEGFFLVWDGPGGRSTLDRKSYREIASEAASSKLTKRYHVYASFAPYIGEGIEFYKIPDRVLEHLGFSSRADAFNNSDDSDV